MALSNAQSNLLLVLAGKNLFRHLEHDGSFMPSALEKRTVDALEKKGFLRWVKVGQEGYKYNGVVLTDLGRAANYSNVPPLSGK